MFSNEVVGMVGMVGMAVGSAGNSRCILHAEAMQVALLLQTKMSTIHCYSIIIMYNFHKFCTI